MSSTSNRPAIPHLRTALLSLRKERTKLAGHVLRRHLITEGLDCRPKRRRELMLNSQPPSSRYRDFGDARRPRDSVSMRFRRRSDVPRRLRAASRVPRSISVRTRRRYLPEWLRAADLSLAARHVNRCRIPLKNICRNNNAEYSASRISNSSRSIVARFLPRFVDSPTSLKITMNRECFESSISKA